MAMYEFQADDGTVIERYYPMRDAPELGAAIEEDAKTFRRIASGQTQADVKVYDHVAINLPRWAEGAPHYDQHGHPAFQSKREATEFGKNHGYKWD